MSESRVKQFNSFSLASPTASVRLLDNVRTLYTAEAMRVCVRASASVSSSVSSSSQRQRTIAQ